MGTHYTISSATNDQITQVVDVLAQPGTWGMLKWSKIVYVKDNHKYLRLPEA